MSNLSKLTKGNARENMTFVRWLMGTMGLAGQTGITILYVL